MCFDDLWYYSLYVIWKLVKFILKLIFCVNKNLIIKYLKKKKIEEVWLCIDLLCILGSDMSIKNYGEILVCS